jgi:hypothetical protein
MLILILTTLPVGSEMAQSGKDRTELLGHSWEEKRCPLTIRYRAVVR